MSMQDNIFDVEDFIKGGKTPIWFNTSVAEIIKWACELELERDELERQNSVFRETIKIMKGRAIK